MEGMGTRNSAVSLHGYVQIYKMFIYGLVVGGPLGHKLFELLAVVFRGRTGLLAMLLQVGETHSLAERNHSSYTSRQCCA